MVVVQVVVVHVYRTIYLSMCLSICLSYCIYLSIYLSIFLSFFLFLPLSYLILSYVILSISVSLSLFLFWSGDLYLCICKPENEAMLRDFHIFFNLKTSKTQQLSETVSIRELDGCRRVFRNPLFFLWHFRLRNVLRFLGRIFFDSM